ncbi:MAG: Hsp20/alpha crystallin family protein, partial [Ilumatobacteraceae bacterium]
MSTLLRFDPFREIDRMLDQAISQTRRPSFPMDAYRHGETVVVHFDLPGVDPASIDLEFERQTLTVTAERSWRPVDGDQLLATERVH